MPLVYLQGVAAPVAIEGTADKLRALIAEKAKSRFIPVTPRSDFMPGTFVVGDIAFIEPSKVVGIFALADEQADEREE